MTVFRMRPIGGTTVLLFSLIAWGPSMGAELPLTAGPYVPSPQVIVDRMLQMAAVGPGDFVVDLGSGDGRMVRTAAKVYGARGFGVDIDADLVERSNAAARREGVADRAVFYERDIFNANIGQATVITLYVLPEMMLRLRPKMLSELKPGTRIVSHDYHFREWAADERNLFDVPEKKEVLGFSQTAIYLWIVPASVGGRWQLQLTGAGSTSPLALELSQVFQQVSGVAYAGTRKSELTGVSLRGDALAFSLEVATRAGAEMHAYRGKVLGERMEGDVAVAGEGKTRRLAWSARRLAAPATTLAQ